MLVNLKKYGFMTKGDILINKPVAEALLKAKELLPKGYNFKIWDGKRSINDQRKIVQRWEKVFKKKKPKNWYNLLIRYTGGYEQLKQKDFPYMHHISGNAVDLTLAKRRKLLDLGGIDFSEKDNLNYYEKKERLSKKEKEIRDSRRLLKKAMRKEGFKCYNPEWWHWGHIK